MEIRDVSLGEVCSIKGGFAFKSGDFVKNGVPVLKIANIVDQSIKFNGNSSFLPKDYLEKYNDYIVQNGDILIALSGATTGKYGMYSHDEKALLNQRVAKITPNPDYLDSKFFFYCMSKLQSKILYKAAGAAQPNISTNDIASFVILLPPIKLQKEIVKILDTSKGIIDRRVSQIKALDQLTQSVFLEMFGDPSINKNKYIVGKLKSYITKKPINGFFAKNDLYHDDGNAEVVWIGDFVNKREVNITGLRKVEATGKDIEKYKIHYGDILFCRSSLNVEGIGKAAYVPQHNKKNLMFECHSIKINLKEEIIPEFFQVLTETGFFRNQIMKNAKTATMTTISQSGIEECEIIVPELSKQKEFVNIYHKIENEKLKLNKSLVHLEHNFNSIMQQAFRGELFIKEKVSNL